jgi:TPR repeat protein
MPLQPDAITDDRFEQALALHQKALEGDAKSQNLLGNIILECYFFAENQQSLKDDIALLLQTLPEDNRTELQAFADQVNGCSEFHQDNLQLFLDENAQVPESGITPPFLDVALSWYAKAALQGEIAAIGQLVNYRSNLIDYREVEDILSEALVAHNPDAVFSLGLCLADQQDAKVKASGISLMQSVCGAGQSCQMQNKNPLRNVYLSGCLATNSGPQNAAQKEQQLQCYQPLNLPKIMEQYHPQQSAQERASIWSVKGSHIGSRQAAKKLMQQCLEP